VPDLSALANLADLRNLAVPAVAAYVVVLLCVAIDAVLPMMPGEAVVVTGGVLAAAGELQLAVLLPATVVGALAGDCTAFALGRRAGRAGLGRALRARRGRRAIRWAASALDRRGGPIVLAARFVPGGRTSAAVAAGFVRFPAGRYVGWSALAGVLWSMYAAGLGYLGGTVFTERPWAALLVALAVATAVGLVRSYVILDE
jgi:membrane-associated protein